MQLCRYSSSVGLSYGHVFLDWVHKKGGGVTPCFDYFYTPCMYNLICVMNFNLHIMDGWVFLTVKVQSK